MSRELLACLVNVPNVDSVPVLTGGAPKMIEFVTL
jgi:hypothetical protein